MSTSIFVENCTNSKLYLSCQQLRTHSSKNLDIYLRVRSRAIIEDCTNIRFAPYIWNDKACKEFHEKAGLDNALERYVVNVKCTSHTKLALTWLT